MGCEKTVIDERCIQECSKSTSIINLKGDSFLINKQKGGYPCIYSDKPFLNTDIIDELAGFFDGFFIDLSLDPSDNIGEDKTRVIGLFENLLNGKEDAKRQIKEVIKVSTDSQYKKGL
jgi:putative protease